MSKPTTSSCLDSIPAASAKRLSANKLKTLKDTVRILCLLVISGNLAVFLSACEGGKNESGAADTLMADTIIQPAGQRYLHFSGKIGQRAVSMEIIQERGYEGDPFFSGYFLFDDEEVPIPFYSERGDSLKVLILKESGDNGHESGNFTGEFISGTFKGIFTGQNGKKEPFHLSLSSPDAGASFRSLTRDTLFAAIDSGNPPKARYSWHFLLPEEKWLQDSVLTELHGDSLFRLGKGDPATIFRLLGEQYAKDYRADIQPLLSEEDAFGMMNYDLSYGMEVRFNRHKLLSLAFTQYQYTGGAHGMMYSRCVCYDLAAKKRIRKDDLFRPGNKDALKTAINKAAKMKYRVKNLSEILLVDEIEVTDNFFLTGKGICFVYQPYEIGPFSMGEQEIYIPFSDIRNLLK